MATAVVDSSQLGETRSLPATWYTSEQVLETEKRELFFKHWHYACHASQVDAPGKYVSGKLFDQEFFLIGGQDGEIRAFYNVCPHRAHRLVDGNGVERSIVCPYHRWTYDLKGRLLGERGLNDMQSFAKTDICLSDIRVDRILDFVFISLNPDVEPLETYAAGLSEQILSVVPDVGEYQLTTGSDYFGGGYRANWKVMIDNFMECYHCEAAHPSFADMMNIPAVTFSFHGNFSHQIAPTAMKADNAAFPLDLGEDETVGHFWYLFPNVIFSVFPGVKSFSVSRCDSLGVDNTIRHFDFLVAPGVDPERLAARADWGMNVVNQEDKALCENVQIGMRQQGFSQGYYLVDPDKGNITEEGVQFFHRHYARSMADKLIAIGNTP